MVISSPLSPELEPSGCAFVWGCSSSPLLSLINHIKAFYSPVQNDSHIENLTLTAAICGCSDTDWMGVFAFKIEFFYVLKFTVRRTRFYASIFPEFELQF
jgi:hypothetical protein